MDQRFQYIISVTARHEKLASFYKVSNIIQQVTILLQLSSSSRDRQSLNTHTSTKSYRRASTTNNMNTEQSLVKTTKHMTIDYVSPEPLGCKRETKNIFKNQL